MVVGVMNVWGTFHLFPQVSTAIHMRPYLRDRHQSVTRKNAACATRAFHYHRTANTMHIQQLRAD